MKQRVLEIKDLSKQYGDRQVLKKINLSVNKGEVLVILGPSGSGKSTLLRCLNGLEDFQSGEILFKGEVIEQNEKTWQVLRPKIGMVFQSYDLFPNKTVLENCMIAPLIVQKRERQEVETLVRKLLDQVGLGDYTHRYPHQLSGGQKQRVAIVRCLAMEPELILLDEITASLDPEVVQEVLRVILNLAKEDATMVIVTHQMEFAKRVSDKVAFLDQGELVEVTEGTSFFESPKTKRAKRFIESLTLDYGEEI